MADNVASAAMVSSERFREAMKKALKELGLSVVEFSKAAKVPQSTLYKVLSEGRDPNIKTARQMVAAIRRLESKGNESRPFVAVIASRPYLNEIVSRTAKLKGKEVRIREYPANNLEEAIIASIHAERDGAGALVCAPIVSPTVEKILSIPIITIMPIDGLIEAVETAVKRIGR